MKKLILAMALLTLAAAPALAYVQPGHLQSKTSSGNSGGTTDGTDGGSLPTYPRPVAQPAGDPGTSFGDDGEPTKPVPEPGTMVLTSMGLIALGVAARRRRGS